MALLKGVNYNPAAAVSKLASALQAMVAMDTVNLRLAVTVPANGIILIRQSGIVHGGTAMPAILLGVMNGATVLSTKAPMTGGVGTIAATSMIPIEATYLLTGLTPGAALNLDAAWSVETLVASSAIKYGGPNDATANNAFGGFSFEAWEA